MGTAKKNPVPDRVKP